MYSSNASDFVLSNVATYLSVALNFGTILEYIVDVFVLFFTFRTHMPILASVDQDTFFAFLSL